MPHDDQVNDFRVGGWFQEETPSTALMPYRPRVPARSPADSERAHRVLLACGVAVVTGVAAIMALILTGDGEGGDVLGPAAAPIVFPSYEPLTPVSLLPPPASSSAVPPVILPTRTLPVAEHTTRPTPTPSRSPSPTTTTKAPVVDLVVGSRVGLEIAGRPGVRLRHRNFVARAEPITTSQDQADSAFTVRKGLARDSCVSLEAVNYPGYFLRHRNFVLRLEQRDRRGPELFERDATFCPARTGDGAAVVLESINYPDRALHLRDDDIIYLDQGAGTAFVVRSAP